MSSSHHSRIMSLGQAKSSYRKMVNKYLIIFIYRKLFLEKRQGSHGTSSAEAQFLFFLVCFTSFFVFRIADLPHSPGVVYYHLL